MSWFARVVLALAVAAACSSEGPPAPTTQSAIESIDITLSGAVSGRATEFSAHPAFPAPQCGVNPAGLTVLSWAQVIAGRTHAFYLELPPGTGDIPIAGRATLNVLADDIDRYAPGRAEVGHVVVAADGRTFRLDGRLAHNRTRAPLRVTGTVVCRAGVPGGT